MTSKSRSIIILPILLSFLIKTHLASLTKMGHEQVPMCDNDMDCFKACVQEYGTGSLGNCENGRCGPCETIPVDFEDYKTVHRMKNTCGNAAECFRLCRQEYGSAPETDCKDGFCTPCYSPAIHVTR